MDFKMDENGDLAVENGDLVMITGVDATVQFIIQTLRLFLKEWFLDETQGVSYFDDIFVKNPDFNSIDGILKRKVLACPGVAELLAFDLSSDPATRVLTVTGRIRAVDGEADFSVTLNTKVGA